MGRRCAFAMSLAALVALATSCLAAESASAPAPAPAPDGGASEGGPPASPSDAGAPDPCADGVRNGLETDIDCGGSSCGKCGDDQSCTHDDDCRGGHCAAGRCHSHVAEVCAGAAHACVLLTSGRIKCWGLNDRGQLGLGDRTSRGGGLGTMGAALASVDLGKNVYAREVVCGGSSTCAILESGSLKCWGGNAAPSGPGTNLDRGIYPDQMGDALPTIDLGTGRTAKQTSGNGDVWCAILDDDTVKCWGTCSLARCGYGVYIDRAAMGDKRPVVSIGLGRKARSISVGMQHTCVLLDDGGVKCWGSNATGQVGMITSSVEANASMTDPVALGTGRTAKAIAVGGSHSCAILDDDSMKCWGGNSVGQLGLRDTVARGLGGNDMGDALPTVDVGTGRKPKALGLGSAGTHTCVLRDDGALVCWGWNSRGQLGHEDTTSRGGELGDMGDALQSIALGTGLVADRVVLGNQHTCMRAGAKIKCWGSNEHGQLGLGDLADRGDGNGAPEMGDVLPLLDLPAP